MAVLRSELCDNRVLASTGPARILEDTNGFAQVPCMMSRLDKLRPKKDLGKIMELWQTRFFVLCEDRLLYFRSYNAFREGKPALGVIPLSHAWLLHVGEDHKGLEFMIKTPFRDFRLRASVGEDLLRSWIQAFDSVGLTVMDPNGLHEHRNPGRPVAREPCPGFAADSGVVLNVQRKQDLQAVLKDSSAADSSPPSALLSPPAPPPPPKPVAANATDLLAQRALATKESPPPARPPPPAGAPPPPKQFKEQPKQQREQQQLQQIEILKAELERMKLEQVMCDKDPGPEEVHNQLQQCATEDSTVSAASTATNRAQELHSPSSCSMDEDNKLSIPMSLHSPTLSPSNAPPPPPLAPGPQPQATAVKLKTKKPMNMQDELLAKLNKIKQKNGVHQGPELC